MFSTGWRRDLRTATTRGQCAAYVKPATSARRHGAVCKRTGIYTLTVGNLLPDGPYCHQHGRRAEDRATARAITTGQTVRLEAITD